MFCVQYIVSRTTHFTELKKKRTAVDVTHIPLIEIHDVHLILRWYVDFSLTTFNKPHIIHFRQTLCVSVSCHFSLVSPHHSNRRKKSSSKLLKCVYKYAKLFLFILVSFRHICRHLFSQPTFIIIWKTLVHFRVGIFYSWLSKFNLMRHLFEFFRFS